MRPSQDDSPFRDISIEADERESVKKRPRPRFELLIRADQDLHPGHDADGALLVETKFRAGLRDVRQKIDQDVRVE